MRQAVCGDQKLCWLDPWTWDEVVLRQNQSYMQGNKDNAGTCSIKNNILRDPTLIGSVATINADKFEFIDWIAN